MTLFAMNMMIVVVLATVAIFGVGLGLRDLWRRDWKDGVLNVLASAALLGMVVGYIALMTSACTLPNGKESRASYCPASMDPPPAPKP